MSAHADQVHISAAEARCMERDESGMTFAVVSNRGQRLRFRVADEGEAPAFRIVATPPGEALVDETISMLAVLQDPLRVLVRRRLEELLVSGRLYAQELSAVRASTVYVDLQPCEAWVDLMSAFRAGDLDGVARFAHGGSFQG